MATASATYFYLDDQRATDLSQARRWTSGEASSSGASPWTWLTRRASEPDRSR